MAVGSQSKIQWTDSTWNPVKGCTRVSSGCTHCYAERVALSLARQGNRQYQPLITEVNGHPRWTGKLAFVETSGLVSPLIQKKPLRIFVNSMSDLFHEDVPIEFIASVFAVMAAAPQHQFQILTKRAERMAEVLGNPDFRGMVGKESTRLYADTGIASLGRFVGFGWPPFGPMPWPLSNVWLGVSCEGQMAADLRVPRLMATPAAVRFVSVEPMLEPVSMVRLPLGPPFKPRPGTYNALAGEWSAALDGVVNEAGAIELFSGTFGLPRLDWIIIGGESGDNSARPFPFLGAEALVTEAKAAGVPVFVKQLGTLAAQRLGLRDNKGGAIEEWQSRHPELAIREYPAQYGSAQFAASP